MATVTYYKKKQSLKVVKRLPNSNYINKYGVVKRGSDDHVGDPMLTYLTNKAAALLNIDPDLAYTQTRKGEVVMVRALVGAIVYKFFGNSIASLYIARFYNLKCHDGSTIRHHRYKIPLWEKTDPTITMHLKSLERCLYNRIVTHMFKESYINRETLKQIRTQYESTRSKL